MLRNCFRIRWKCSTLRQQQPSPMPISRRTDGRSTPTHPSALLPNYNRSSRVLNQPTIRLLTASRKTNHGRRSTQSEVAAHVPHNNLATTIKGATTQTVRDSRQLSNPIPQNRKPDRPHATTKSWAKQAEARRPKQLLPRRSSTPTVNCMRQIQIRLSATARCAHFTQGHPFATPGAAMCTVRGETAGGDAVDRRRPPSKQQ